MNPTSIFSEDFYNRHLFRNGERVSIAENGSFIVTSQESKWNRFKRFLAFQQDPYIERVHEQLKTTIDQINSQSGPIFTSLKNEVHTHGEKKFKYLKMNLNALRKKLDYVGQINLFSRIILKLVNTVRYIFHKPSIELKTYANITFEREDFFWMANYSRLSNLSKYVNSSFSINLYNLEKEGLKLTEQDKQTCIFSAESPDDSVSEKFQELEKGLKTRLRLEQTYTTYNPPHLGTQQILANLSIIFDSERSQFLATISNPRGSQSISKQLKNYLNRLTNEEKSVRYLIRAKTSEGLIQNKELSLIFDNIEQFQAPHERTSSLTLEPNVTYEIFSASEELISTFTIRNRN
jgi:hypothetical protein